MAHAQHDRRPQFLAGHPALATLVALALFTGVSGVVTLIGSGKGSPAAVTHRQDGAPRTPSLVRPVLALLMRSEHKPARAEAVSIGHRPWTARTGLEPVVSRTTSELRGSVCEVRPALLNLPPPAARA